MTFKIIYTADLHGNEAFYKRLLKKAEEDNINAVVIGGDLCPKGEGSIQSKIESQKFFIEKFLIPLFRQFKKENNGKEIYLIMGNDDFRINLKFLEKADKAGILKSLHKKSVKLNSSLDIAGECWIAGYSFINPTPFRLKDWEKPDTLTSFKSPYRDLENGKLPQQILAGEIRTAEKESGTINEDLEKLKSLSNPKKTVYVIHAPPFNTKLDIITTGAHVGSASIRHFIEEEQPLLTLHGHIHESPKMSGSWKDKIGKTLCINVGSSYPEDKANCAVINLDNLDVNYFEL